MDFSILYVIAGALILPAIIFSLIAQTKVHSTFNRYAQTASSSGVTADQVARRILDSKGLTDIAIQKINGELTDNYNSKTKVVSLSSSVYGSTSISAIGVACHEVGHAIQDGENYMPLKIRQIVVPVSNIASRLLLPLVIIGFILDAFYIGGIIGATFIWAGVAFYGLSFLVNLITLPVEYNASTRALEALAQDSVLDDDELAMANKVLNSAALTYVAATVISLLYFLRFLFMILSITKRD